MHVLPAGTGYHDEAAHARGTEVTRCYLCYDGKSAFVVKGGDLDGLAVCRLCSIVHGISERVEPPAPPPEDKPHPSYTNVGGWWPTATAKEDE